MRPCTVGLKILDPFVEKGHIGRCDHLPLNNTGRNLRDIFADTDFQRVSINRKSQRLAFV